MNSIDNKKGLIESLIFISGEGISLSELSKVANINSTDCETLVNTLIDEYLERDGGIFLQEIAGKIRFATSEKVYLGIRDFIQEKKKERLSKGMMETLAIITYRQPITLFEIEEIRGVNSRSMVIGLVSKKLIKTIGKKEVLGKPALYGTTSEFLEFFGLNSLQELPPPKEVKELNFEELE